MSSLGRYTGWEVNNERRERVGDRVAKPSKNIYRPLLVVALSKTNELQWG